MKISRKAASRAVTFFFVMVMLFGIAVFIYPIFSSWWNERSQTRVIEQYTQSVGKLDTSAKDALFSRAHAYNQALAKLPNPLKDYEDIPAYDQILDITGTGIIGYIDIPKINVHLPVYHGTSPEVLNIAVGHLQGTSLPVGGAGTHAVISAHSGLPSAKLFTSLDQLTEDDRFTISVLDEVLTYEVESYAVVLPHETELLQPEPGRDLVTLLTCTPYGINTHRLLVRAHRIDTISDEETDQKIRIPADAVLVENIIVLPFIILPLILLLIIYWATAGKPKMKHYISAYTCKTYIDKTERNGESSCKKAK